MRVSTLLQLVFFGAALLVAGCATAPSSPPVIEPPMSSPPPEWRHTATRDFERDFPGKGLGISRRYDSEDGWTDVYVYDLGRTWLDGRDDPGFASAFTSACDDVRAAAASGHYADLRMDAPVDARAGTLPIRSARFTYLHRDRSIEAYVVMTCARGQIIKARVSLFVPVSQAARDSIPELVREQVRLIP